VPRLTGESTSQFVRHVPCGECGSSDGASLYDDGHTFCHVCEHHEQGPDEESGRIVESTKVRPVAGLIQVSIEGIPSRGITGETSRKFGYGYGEHRGDTVQVATYRDSFGTPVAQHLRTRHKDFPWLGDAKKASLFGEWVFRDGRRLSAKGGNTMVVITEGEIDAMTVSQLQGNRWPVVSVPNGAGNAAKDVAKSLGWLESFSRVVIMFDQDDAGREATEAVSRTLTPGKAFVAKLPMKDANEMLLAGRGDEVISAIWDAQAWKPDGIVTGEDIWAGVSRAPQPTIAHWPWSDLDEKTRGFRRGEINLIVGGTGTGKSTLCRNLTRSFIEQGLKVGVLSLEEPWEQYAYALLGTMAGKNVRLGDAEEIDPDLRASFDDVKDRLVMYDDQGVRTDDAIFDRLRYMALAEGCQVVVVDHLTVVIGAGREDNDRRHAERFMADLEAITKRTKVIPVVVMHLRKVGDGRSHEEGKAVSMSDIKGSGLIPQLSHVIVAAERDQQGDATDVMGLRVLKCRWTGRTGLAGRVKYEDHTGRIVDHDPAMEKHQVEPIAEGAF